MHRDYDIRTKTGLSMECFDKHEKGLAAPYNEIRRHRPRPKKNVVLLMPMIHNYYNESNADCKDDRWREVVHL